MGTLRAHAAALVTLCSIGLTVVPAAGAVGFQSPTRNIGCVLEAEFARCDITARGWRPPAKPASCRLDWGQGLSVARTSTRGRVVCAGDTALRQGSVLAYGRSLRRGGMTCTSRESGVTCTNSGGHGFRISRGSYRTF